VAEQRKAKLDELVIRGIFDDETYRVRLAECRAEISAHKIELSELQTDRNDFAAVLAYGKHFISNVDKFWAGADSSVKRKVQSLLFPEGIYYSHKTGF